MRLDAEAVGYHSDADPALLGRWPALGDDGAAQDGMESFGGEFRGQAQSPGDPSPTAPIDDEQFRTQLDNLGLRENVITGLLD